MLIFALLFGGKKYKKNHGSDDLFGCKDDLMLGPKAFLNAEISHDFRRNDTARPINREKEES